jgi:uncharacterized membrane protein YfhO
MPAIIPQTGAANIKLTGFSPNSFSFNVNSASQSVLSIFQQYNHNWKVNVKGVAAPLLKMNIAFMGVQVPAGASKVDFVYKPTKVIAAIWLSLATIFIVVLFFILTALKSRRR